MGFRLSGSRGHKYGAVRTEVDGVVFSSKREAKRYGELRILQKANKICDLELQPAFPVVVNGRKVCTYVADFSYYLRTKAGLVYTVEDAKGFKTPVYRLKKKLVEALFGISIQEV